MKIAYLNPFNDGTGYANAGIRTMLAMDSVGLDVYPVEIKLAGQVVPAPDRIQQLAMRHCTYPDVIIQHLLPPMIQYRSGPKNIAFFHCETNNFRRSGWQHNLNMMDQVWVSCQENKDACEESQITKPTHIVPLAYDFDSFVKTDNKLNLPNSQAYTFYSISDWSERKNVKSVIKCYLSAFNRYDNVRLILKCYVDGKPSQESEQIITNEINNIKQQLRLSYYPPIYLITRYLTDEEINSLHNTGDCCVFAEKGAAWNLVAFDSLVYDNSLIINDYGGQSTFVRMISDNVFVTDYQYEIVSNMNQCPYPQLYTGDEYWGCPNEKLIKEYMLIFYNTRDIKSYSNNYEILKQNFGLEQVGNLIKDILNA